jgi:tetratricopeptide (TPR) repeat protein
MLEDITAGEIHKDAQFIEKSEAFLLAKAERERKEAERLALEHKIAAERRQLFTDAGNLMSQEEYSEAEMLLHKLLELEPDNGNAYFYLGQIAGRQEKHDVAFSYYQKAQDLANTTDWLRAWAMVRMGRYLAHQQKFEEARLVFGQVVKMEGDLKGARKDAVDLIGKLPENDSK